MQFSPSSGDLGTTKFYSLLQQLADEHERGLAEVRSNGMQNADAEVDKPPSTKENERTDGEHVQLQSKVTADSLDTCTVVDSGKEKHEKKEACIESLVIPSVVPPAPPAERSPSNSGSESSERSEAANQDGETEGPPLVKMASEGVIKRVASMNMKARQLVVNAEASRSHSKSNVPDIPEISVFDENCLPSGMPASEGEGSVHLSSPDVLHMGSASNVLFPSACMDDFVASGEVGKLSKFVLHTVWTDVQAQKRIPSREAKNQKSRALSARVSMATTGERSRGTSLRSCSTSRSWRDFLPGSSALSSKSPQGQDVLYARTLGALQVGEADEQEKQKRRTGCILHPNAPYRLVWDLLGVALIAYDIIMIPMALFELPGNTFIHLMNWFTLFFWTLDIVTSFLVGYVERGSTIMDPWKIAKNYSKTWLIPDVTIVICDWVYNLAASSGSSNSNVGDLGRFARVMRTIRTMRLLRLLKLRRIVNEIQDHIDSEFVVILGDVVKLILLVVVLSHVIACVWYAIGNAGRHGHVNNWVTANNMQQETLELRYVTSLHWSLSQLMMESMDVQAYNIFERTFTICTLIFGLLVFSSVVSRITNSMIQLQKMGHNTSKQFWLLRRFLRERGVPKLLSSRIQRFLEYACQQEELHVQEANVKILELLSNQLRDELQYAIAVPQLTFHPFFDHVSQVSDVTMHRLSNLAIERRSLACEDSVFFRTEVSLHMYFVADGELSYSGARSSSDFGAFSQKAGHGDWFCEAALWTSWTHLGDLHATTESDLISIDSKKFGETMSTNPMTWGLASEYAEGFIIRLNTVPSCSLSDLANINASDPMTAYLQDFFKHEVPEEEAPSVRHSFLFQMFPIGHKNEDGTRKSLFTWNRTSKRNSVASVLPMGKIGRQSGQTLAIPGVSSGMSSPVSIGGSSGKRCVEFTDLRSLPS